MSFSEIACSLCLAANNAASFNKFSKSAPTNPEVFLAISFKSTSGLIDIKVNKHDNLVDTLLLNMTELFKELEKDYEKYIKINEEVL